VFLGLNRLHRINKPPGLTPLRLLRSKPLIVSASGRGNWELFVRHDGRFRPSSSSRAHHNFLWRPTHPRPTTVQSSADSSSRTSDDVIRCRLLASHRAQCDVSPAAVTTRGRRHGHRVESSPRRLSCADRFNSMLIYIIGLMSAAYTDWSHVNTSFLLLFDRNC
jgi:hypothetical protein